MKKYLLLVIIIVLTSCNNLNSSNEENFKTSFDVFSYYQETTNYLENIYLEKAKINNKDNDIVGNLTIDYWNKYVELISVLQEKFTDAKIKNYFIKKIGEDKVNKILNIDINKIFYNRKYNEIDLYRIEILTEEILEEIKRLDDYRLIKEKLNLLSLYMDEYISNLRYINVLSDLYLDNDFYLEEKNKLEAYYPNLVNKYKKIFKNLLGNNLYKDLVVEDYHFSIQDISNFLDNDLYSERLLDLFERENTLENSYYLDANIVNRQDIFLKLVEVRKLISKELGYSSYLEYVFNDVYQRNYTISDAVNLVENIKNSDLLKENYLFYSYNLPNLSKYKVSEKELVENLKYVSHFLEESKEIIDEFLTYGFYNFDYRSNKVSSSYKTYLSSKEDEQFILLNVNGNILDYSTLFHEFGHYLAGALKNDKYEGNKFDLDIAEVHSQSLEYIMSDYFYLFLDMEQSEALKSQLLFDALWTIYSTCVVFEFEKYVYEEPINILSVQNKFNQLIKEYTYPFSFGIEGKDYLYTSISHLYNSPGYYISYLTSIIPSLELFFSSSNDIVRKQYKNILSYGTSNDFIYVLNQVNLSSPFEKNIIDSISYKIDEMKKS